MSGPKHLWAGDWERESEAARARRAKALPVREAEPEPVQAPAAPAGRVPRRWQLPRVGRPSRAVVLVAVALLVLAGAAYGLTRIGGSEPRASSQKAWLGVQLAGWQGGVLIASVVPGSPAQSAGLRPGDVITEVQNRPAVVPLDVSAAVDALVPGETLQLQFQRHGAMQTANVKLAAHPSGSSYP